MSVVATITHGQVRESVAIARSHGEKFFEQIVWQVENEVWTILGYDSWDEMRQVEYAGLGVVAPRADRPELVSRLRAKGLTQKTIADTIGVSEATASRQLANASSGEAVPATVTNSRGQQRPAAYAKAAAAPAPEPPELTDEPGRITKLTGPGSVSDPRPAATPSTDKTSTRPEPEPETQTKPEPPQRKRRPLPDAFWELRYDLGKKTESLHRLTQDDRFPTNKKKVAEVNLNDLLRCRDLLQQVIDQLS